MRYPKLIHLCGMISILSLYFNNPALATSPPETSFKPFEVSGSNLVSGDVKTFDLSKAKKATVLVFLSAKCPCSASHQPTVNQLANEFEKDGFEFIGIHSNADEDFEFAKSKFQNSGLKIPVIRDENSKVAIHFGALKTPHVFVVDPSLKVLFQGGIDNSKLTEKATQHYLKDALLAIRAGKEPAEKSVRVLGCEIKRTKL